MVMDDNEKARQEAADAEAKRLEAERAAAAAEQDETKADDEVASPYRPFDPYLDMDTNCNMGTAHGAPVGPMTQGCGPLGRLPFGNRANLRPLGTGDPDAMYNEPTVVRDEAARSALKPGDEGLSQYQKEQIAKNQQSADKVREQTSRGSKKNSK